MSLIKKTTKTAKPSKVTPTAEALVKLRVRWDHENWVINTDIGTYKSVGGIIEVPAEIASRLEGDTDYEIVG